MSAALQILPERPEKVTKDGYPYKGAVLPRVTDILGMAPGQFLLSWYAKTAAIESAHWLLMCGEYSPSTTVHVETDVPLTDLVERRGKRPMDLDEAVRNIVDWKSNMRAPERYRDERARVGSVLHHVRYDLAHGIRPDDADLLPYLKGHAAKVLLKPEYEPFLKREYDLGNTMDSLAAAIAYDSLPRAQKRYQFQDRFQPVPIMIGQEAMVVNTDEGYAGTLDDIAEYKREHWEKWQSWPVEFLHMDEVTLVDDDKTSKSLDPKVPFQLAAYSRAEKIVLDDGSEHDIPTHQGLGAIHVRHEGDVVIKCWPEIQADRETGEVFNAIDRLYDGFCGLNVFYRCINDMPRASRIRRPAKPKPLRRTDDRKVDW